MLETMKRLIASQYEASLCTLGHCVAKCPNELWNARVARFPFCQVAFHTLFFADYYLGSDAESLRQQPFHLANPNLFGDYEQLLDREPVSLYERPQIEAYLDFCRKKAMATLAAETQESLCAPAKFPRKNFSRAELHVYNIRHIQHHAAQLILRLRLDSGVDIPWIGAGWRDPAPNKLA
ncbi:MAG: DinB family protein [Planctomycetes bacterium]|nr:DinB family protein [Planctomycetota bacterium]